MKCDLLSQVGQVNFLSGYTKICWGKKKKTFERQAYVCVMVKKISGEILLPISAWALI